MTSSCYWSRSRSAPAQSVQAPARADVAIVGSGVAGLSMAWWLSRRSIETVVFDLLDDPGNGAVSAAGVGLVEVGTPDLYGRTAAIIGARAADAVLEVSGDNARLIREFAADAGVGYQAAGAFNLTTEKSELAELTATARLLSGKAASGSDWDVLGPEANREAGTVGFLGGVFRRSDATLDPVLFLDVLAHQASGAGATICRDTRVDDVREDASGVKVVTTAGTTSAEMAVLAAGAGSVSLHGSLRGQIVPVLGQAMAWCGVPTAGPPVSANFGHIRFRTVESEEGGTDLVAWHTPWSLGGSDPEGLRHAVQEDLQTRIEAYVSERFAGLADSLGGKAGVSHRWAAHEAYTVDNLPLVGPLPGRPRLISCCGFSGHDWSLAFASANMIAGAIDSEPLPDIISPMSPRRFIGD